jgi:hypothetical protein
MLLPVFAVIIAGAHPQVGQISAGVACPQVARNWIMPRAGLPEHRVMMTVRLRGGDIIWSGRMVSRGELRHYLLATRVMNPLPTIIFDPSGASDCAVAGEIRDLIDEAAACQNGGICGEGTVEQWLREPGTDFVTKPGD